MASLIIEFVDEHATIYGALYEAPLFQEANEELIPLPRCLPQAVERPVQFDDQLVAFCVVSWQRRWYSHVQLFIHFRIEVSLPNVYRAQFVVIFARKHKDESYCA